ncbi:MAG: hypothetical protein K0T99_00605 [Alphaproteobacteria bacterium]|nr:hypothetical protein [Alphaproteobacteria bacterium]
MSFINTQIGIIQQCAYETSVIVAPGTTIFAYKYYPQKLRTMTSVVSAGYFLSCITKKEISTYFSSPYDNYSTTALINIDSGLAGGITYAFSAAYLKGEAPSLLPSIFMSCGYTFVYNYLDRPQISLGIFGAELGTSLLCGMTKQNAEQGAYSGLVFVVIDAIESTFTQYQTSDHNTSDANVEYLPGEVTDDFS